MHFLDPSLFTLLPYQAKTKPTWYIFIIMLRQPILRACQSLCERPKWERMLLNFQVLWDYPASCRQPRFVPPVRADVFNNSQYIQEDCHRPLADHPLLVDGKSSSATSLKVWGALRGKQWSCWEATGREPWELGFQSETAWTGIPALLPSHGALDKGLNSSLLHFLVCKMRLIAVPIKLWGVNDGHM